MLQLYDKRLNDRMILIALQAEDQDISPKIARKKLPQTDCATNVDSRATFRTTAQISNFESQPYMLVKSRMSLVESTGYGQSS